MSEEGESETNTIAVEAILREELEHGDAVLSTLAPILGHLVFNTQNQLFSDEIVASVRGMAGSVVNQFLIAKAQITKTSYQDAPDQAREILVDHLLAEEAFLSHCHALTIEASLAHKLQDRSAIDAVLSPMLQALIASSEADKASMAMAILTAQARFVGQQRRMELPLSELPGEIFDTVLRICSKASETTPQEDLKRTEKHLRAEYDESGSRIAQLSKLVSGMGAGARAALSVSHAGVAIFVTALSYLSDQRRDVAVLSTNDRQVGRLALALRGSGLKIQEVEEQFLYLHPEISLPEGFDMLRTDRAREILQSASNSVNG